MPGVDKPVQLGPWPGGIDNTNEETEQPLSEAGLPISVREADDLDLTKAGWVKSRAGQTQVHVGVRSHSLWSSPGLTWGLFADNDELCVLHEDESVDQLGVPLSAGRELSYALMNDRIFWTNRAQCGLVTLDFEPHPWAPVLPGGQPTLSAVDGFGMQAGTYQVAITFTDALGRESGARPNERITLTDGQGIQLTSIPQPTNPAHAVYINVYVSGPDDTTLKRYARPAAGTTSLTVFEQANGPTLQTSLLISMPPGQIVRYHNSRQFVAIGRHILHSPAFRYGLYDPARSYTGVPEEVTLMEPVGEGGDGAGLFVSSGNTTYFYSGPQPDQYRMRRVYSAGAVRGGISVPGSALGYDTKETVACWLATDGKLLLGLPGGQIVPQENNAVIDSAESSALLFREAKGIKQLIAALRAPQPQGLSIGDYAVAHIVVDERLP